MTRYSKPFTRNSRPLFSLDQLAAWAAENGVDAAKFRAAFESPGVSAKAMRAEQISRDYKVNGVPSVVVDGKYIAKGHTHEDMLKIARQLVDKSAAERKTRARDQESQKPEIQSGLRLAPQVSANLA